MSNTVIRKRTKAGLDSQQRDLAIYLFNQKKHGIDEICRTVGISKPTLYAYVKRRRGKGFREARSPNDNPTADAPD